MRVYEIEPHLNTGRRGFVVEDDTVPLIDVLGRPMPALVTHASAETMKMLGADITESPIGITVINDYLPAMTVEIHVHPSQYDEAVAYYERQRVVVKKAARKKSHVVGGGRHPESGKLVTVIEDSSIDKWLIKASEDDVEELTRLFLVHLLTGAAELVVDKTLPPHTMELYVKPENFLAAVIMLDDGVKDEAGIK